MSNRKKKNVVSVKKNVGLMKYACWAMIFLLFMVSFRVPGLSYRIILIFLVIFEGFLILNHEKLLLDTKTSILLIIMPIHVIIYNLCVMSTKDGRGIALACFPALYYLLGKQLLYYPQEIQDEGKKMWRVIGAILMGHLIFSLIEIYSFYTSAGYPGRIWYDFWTKSTYYATRYSFYAIVWISLLFYGLWSIIQKKVWRGLCLIVGIIVISALNIFNGNRLHVGSLVIVFAFSLLIFCIQNRKNRKLLIRVGAVIAGIAIILFLLFVFDVGHIKEFYYVQRLLNVMSDVRFDIYKNVFDQMPTYLWGGRKIDISPYGHAHNMWLQIYIDSGIISFLGICLFTILNIRDCIKIILSNEIKTSYKYIIPPICCGFLIYFFFEDGGEDYFIYYTLFAGIAAQIIQAEMKKES